MSKRIFDGEFTYGEHHFYPNRLEGVGAETVLHYHDFPHVALFWPGDGAEYEVFAIQSDGAEVSVPLDAWGFRYIEANVRHRIRLTKGERGAFVCMFSMYGPDGKRRRDAKTYTGGANGRI